MALAMFTNKQFCFAIWPLLLRWVSEKAFRDWWHFKLTFYGVSGCRICPDCHIIIRGGTLYLKVLRFRSNCPDFATYMWTSPDHFTDKKVTEMLIKT